MVIIQRSNENTRDFWQQIWVFKNWQNEKVSCGNVRYWFLCKCDGRKNLTLGDNRVTRQCSHFSKVSIMKNCIKCFLFVKKNIYNNANTNIQQSEIPWIVKLFDWHYCNMLSINVNVISHAISVQKSYHFFHIVCHSIW